MRYASLQLLTLAAQQVALVHLRQEAEGDGVFSPANRIEDYDTRVADGAWVVRKLEVQVKSPVPSEAIIDLTSTIEVRPPSNSKPAEGWHVDFTVKDGNGFTAKGTAIFRGTAEEAA